ARPPRARRRRPEPRAGGAGGTGRAARGVPGPRPPRGRRSHRPAPPPPMGRELPSRRSRPRAPGSSGAGRASARPGPTIEPPARRTVRFLRAKSSWRKVAPDVRHQYDHPQPTTDNRAMSRIVMKFGGTSVADLERIRNVADRVKREVEAGSEVAVVVSAMAGVTNQLVAHCQGLSPLHDAREYDTVVATGEQVTTGLLAIALQELG